MAVISRRNLNLIQTKSRQALALTTTLLLAVSTFAQQPAPDPQDNPPAVLQKAANGKDVLITIPAGTRIALVLTQPVQTRYLRRGDDVYAQITSPVASGDEVVITYEAGRPNGSKSVNTEILTFDSDKLRRAEVYFGWSTD